MSLNDKCKHGLPKMRDVAMMLLDVPQDIHSKPVFQSSMECDPPCKPFNPGQVVDEQPA